MGLEKSKIFTPDMATITSPYDEEAEAVCRKMVVAGVRQLVRTHSDYLRRVARAWLAPDELELCAALDGFTESRVTAAMCAAVRDIAPLRVAATSSAHINTCLPHVMYIYLNGLDAYIEVSRKIAERRKEQPKETPY